MASGQTTDPQLTDFEWDLLLELVKREHRELPHEIHHTSTHATREELRRRFEAVEQLEAKLQLKAAHK